MPRAIAVTAVVILGFAQAASAQRPAITGRVVEAGTRTPVTGAHVQLVEARRDDITHEDGGFDFLTVRDGAYTLRITRIGLAPVTRKLAVRAGRSDSLVVEMQPAALQLEAIVTTGTVGARSAQETLSPTTVLTDAQLDRQLQSTLAATIQSQPGVTMSTLGPATARPVIRGLVGDRVVVLEDGARSGDLSSTSSDHAVAIDPITVKQFEIVRGPMSLLYGSSALGGVVNAIREEVPATRGEHVTGSVSAEGSSVDQGSTAGGFATGSLGRLTFRGEGSARHAGDLNTPLGTLAGSGVRTLTGAGGASYVGADGYGGASYRYFNNSYDVPGGFVGGHNQSVHINMLRHVTRGEGDWHPASGPLSSLKATSTYTDYFHEEIEHGGSLGTRFNQQIANADLRANHEGSGRLAQLSGGAHWQHRSIQTGGTLRTPSTDDNSLAGFGVAEFGFDKLRLQTGARYDWARYVPKPGSIITVNGRDIEAVPRNFGSVSGSLGGLYDLAGGAQIGASVSRAYRTPDFNELYSNGPHLASFSFDVGNPSLEQETGIGLDAFVRLTRDRGHGEVAVFRNRMSNFIFPHATGDIGLQGNRPKFQFTGRDALLAGAEGGGEITVAPHVILEATLSYVRGTFIGPVDSLPPDSAHAVFNTRPGSEYIPFMPPLNGHVSARFDTQRWFGSVSSRFAAKQANLGDFETETAGYALLDGSAGLRLFDGRRSHAVTLRLENALDQVYRNHLSRTKEISPEAGRNVALVYRITF
jgi:iron complex outermembrane receptor protein